MPCERGHTVRVQVHDPGPSHQAPARLQGRPSKGSSWCSKVASTLAMTTHPLCSLEGVLCSALLPLGPRHRQHLRQARQRLSWTQGTQRTLLCCSVAAAAHVVGTPPRSLPVQHLGLPSRARGSQHTCVLALAPAGPPLHKHDLLPHKLICTPCLLAPRCSIPFFSRMHALISIHGCKPSQAKPSQVGQSQAKARQAKLQNVPGTLAVRARGVTNFPRS